MTRTTQKELKRLAKIHVDCTHMGVDDYNNIIKKEGWLEQIMYAAGMYGCNGVALRGHNTGELYVVAGRSTALYIFH